MFDAKHLSNCIVLYRWERNSTYWPS